jgi:uncharacterized DUF497 family protein
MKFTHDSSKDKTNFDKHGLSLNEANFLDWDYALNWIDDRKDYVEIRWVALVPMNERLYCIVYVYLKQSRRAISLRKANLREIQKYEEEINST